MESCKRGNAAGHRCICRRMQVTEEGDAIGGYEATHEDNFLGSWLREDGEDKKEKWRWTGKLKKR